jgi:hypothetical protein
MQNKLIKNKLYLIMIPHFVVFHVRIKIYEDSLIIMLNSPRTYTCNYNKLYMLCKHQFLSHNI